MNDQRKNQLKREISTISNITLKAQEAYLIVSYLQQDEDDADLNYQKKMSSFFYYSRIIYWQITIIEIAKLLNEKEKFSVWRIIKKIKPDGEYSELKVSMELISKWEEKLALEKESIKNIKDQRDKVYAHEDGSDDIKNLIPLSKIDFFLNLFKEIIVELEKPLGLPHRMFNLINSPAANLKYIIRMSAKGTKYEKEAYRELTKQYGLEN
ncbi:hypothetical protein [Sphingobacterium sp.]|uniref:AbiU2 domain-containing protein n=1 Tax=Sphingobacterium sp. TaxID=341027 RepID=UPI0028A1CB82|nr:hypothetical protein [Sphingobacterium sp.]